MKLAQAKEYYEMGILKSFGALKDPLTDGWLLAVEIQDGRSWTMHTALGEPKVYASMDSITKEVDRIIGMIPDWTFKL